MKLTITADDLHSAAAKFGTDSTEGDMSVDLDVIDEFISDSTFHPPMNNAALAYGIILGIQAATDRYEQEGK
jgi:hypothetical protein